MTYVVRLKVWVPVTKPGMEKTKFKVNNAKNHAGWGQGGHGPPTSRQPCPRQGQALGYSGLTGAELSQNQQAPNLPT